MPPKALSESQIVRLARLALEDKLIEWNVDVPPSCSVLMKRALLFQAMSGDVSVLKPGADSVVSSASNASALCCNAAEQPISSGAGEGQGKPATYFGKL